MASASGSTSFEITLPELELGACADLHRCDQSAVRADEEISADFGPVFGDAVIVAGDGSSADIGAGADAGVPDIGEMVGLFGLADLGLFDLDEIADMGVLAEMGAGSQPRKRADDGAFANLRAIDMRKRPDGDIVADSDSPEAIATNWQLSSSAAYVNGCSPPEVSIPI